MEMDQPRKNEKVDKDKGSLGKSVRVEETLSGLASHACKALAGTMDAEKLDGIEASLGV